MGSGGVKFELKVYADYRDRPKRNVTIELWLTVIDLLYWKWLSVDEFTTKSMNEVGREYLDHYSISIVAHPRH
jgi:hypothetical protein